jgi:hypothetical protein
MLTRLIDRFDTDDTPYRGSEFPSSASPIVLVLDLFASAKAGAFAYDLANQKQHPPSQPMHRTIRKPAHSRSLRNWRIASIEASRIVSCPLSHLSTVERDTPSSREIRAFFHFDRFANLLKRSRISAFSRSLRSFWVASIVLTLNDAPLIKTHEAQRKFQA